MMTPRHATDETISYDFIIVGAGAAGCAIANRLSADPRHRVLLLEAGAPDNKTEIHIPAAFSKLFKTEYDWNYSAVPQSGLQGRESYWAKGRTLGGSTSINAMMYLRGVPADYDRWEALGNPGWGWRDMLPYFRRSERNSRGGNEWHGDRGLLYVEDLRDRNPLSHAFVAAAQAVGLPYNPDFNGSQLDGVGWVQVTQHRGRRWSTADAFLRPAMRRSNLQLLTGAQCTRVSIRDRRAVGIEYLREGTRQTAIATREIILSGGTVGSTQLLLLSGIGPAQHLQELGIDAIVDLPGVGQNLQDHIAVAVVMGSTQPLSLLNANSPRELLKYSILRRGMLTSSVLEAAAFLRTQPNLIAPDLELQFAPVVFYEYGLVAPTEHGMTIGPTLIAPRSIGSMRLRSPDPLEHPVIDPQYLSDPEGHDLRVMVAGVRQAQEIFAASPMAAYRGRPILPDRTLQSDREIEDYVRSASDGWWHPVGTCRMGTDPLAVVDPMLRVHGVAGLRVADAAVMPTIPRCHTMAPTIAIGEKAADLVLRQSPSVEQLQEHVAF
ncbi:GMC family oxidoreductase [Chroococcidiopsis sp. CCALA 051]|uniref:GMC family oxidoreductase n=1 Tax=Chroococcidiopsis sp. CCALA 051 TaxID=869949 RepID=UPI0018EBBC5D|nr:GMC family oxidoreductase N-terminal domain-containing protein [Chroococcidiopsis sp. CCALA 051]